MNQLPVLIRREFWEHRNTFVVLPAITTGFFVLMMLLTLLVSATDALDASIDIQSDQNIKLFNDSMQPGDIFTLLYQGVSTKESARFVNVAGRWLLMGILWCVMFFYLLGSLYHDRRDRSILFWKSMPVSDATTVISKLVTGLWLVPLVYLVAVAILQLASIMVLSVAALGTETSMWKTLWGSASIFSDWVQRLGGLMFYSFWALPFFGWLIAVSAYAKSVPFVWVVGAPVALAIVERVVTRDSQLADWMWEHTAPFGFLEQGPSMMDDMWSLKMVSAVAVGGVLIIIAIWLRGKADEI
jgi:ABC-2 type transport system permease protein